MIKGITGQLAEAGKIKIGKKGDLRKHANGTWRPPIKLDHFLVTLNTRGQDENLIINDDLMSAIKLDKDGKIRAIPIMLHADTIDEVFPTRYALYTGKSCACSGDGENATQSNKDGTISQVRCPCSCLLAPLGLGDPKRAPKFKCKPNGKLLCSIVAPGQAVAGAIHTWRTTSEISIKRMYGSLEQILAIVGALRSVPLWLKLEPVKVTPAAGKPSTVYCCHVELRESDIAAVQSRALEAAERRRSLGCGDGYEKLLTAPAVGESPEEQAEVAEEYYPEAPPEDVKGPIEEEAPPEPAKTPPDPARSGKLTSQIMAAIGSASSADELASVSVKVGARQAELTKTDITLIDRECKTRMDQLGGTGETETINQDTGEVTTVAAPEQGGLPLDGPPPDDDGIPDFGGPE